MIKKPSKRTEIDLWVSQMGEVAMSVINDANIKTVLAQCEGNADGQECKTEFEGTAIICFYAFTLKNSKIKFRGKNIILYIDKGVNLVNSDLNFDGDNYDIWKGNVRYNDT